MGTPRYAIKWTSKLEGLKSILNEVGERVEGNLVCDVSSDNIVMGENSDKIHNIEELAKGKSKICEIGVNACHSLLFMLEVNPNADYLLFDLGNHAYTKPTLEYIKTEFPNTKIDIIYGDSKKTIPQAIFDNNELLHSFDLVHIDGGHEFFEFNSDFYNCRYLSTKNGVTIFDDYNYPHIKTFIDNRIKIETITKYKNSNLYNTNKHFIYNFK
jgi:hypothetical protein|tara:strand:+ start:79 stop:717 length:639 start_codon:yes stop_codon:yes gene_type:complete